MTECAGDSDKRKRRSTEERRRLADAVQRGTFGRDENVDHLDVIPPRQILGAQLVDIASRQRAVR
jgi:hypothetical protein